jgi:HEPN domain-containing protein
VYLEDLCFLAQQAAEKAIKAVLIKRGVAFPYVRVSLIIDKEGLPRCQP